MSRLRFPQINQLSPPDIRSLAGQILQWQCMLQQSEESGVRQERFTLNQYDLNCVWIIMYHSAHQESSQQFHYEKHIYVANYFQPGWACPAGLLQRQRSLHLCSHLANKGELSIWTFNLNLNLAHQGCYVILQFEHSTLACAVLRVTRFP